MRTLFWIAFVLAVAWWLLTCDCGGECQRRKRGGENSPIAKAPAGHKVMVSTAGAGCGGSLW